MFWLFNVAVNQLKIEQCQLFNKNSGIWCNKQFDSAALPSPATVGWSGTKVRNSSKAFLKTSMFVELMFLIAEGKRLNILTPLTPKEDSLALLTIVEDDRITSCGRPVLPRRPCSLVYSTEYPCTRPCEIFQRKMIIYLSRRRSCEEILNSLSLSQWFKS